MSGNTGKIKLEIIVNDKGSVKIKNLGAEMDKAGSKGKKAFKRTSSSIETMNRKLKSSHGSLMKIGATVATFAGGYGLLEMAKSALDVASSFEAMDIKLDALTKGRGAETLDQINKWALDMPVNTRKAVDTFAMMQAMGLDPTIQKMETLVDVASIFGEEAMPSVARALGQMQTLGKLSAEELNQMAEAGINARKYITEAFGTTVDELQKSDVAIEEIVSTIWKGLAEDFGGASKEAQKGWQGLTAAFESHVTEIERQVMGAGVFSELKLQLDNINKGLSSWLENNQELIKQRVPEYVGRTKNALGGIWDIVSYDPAIIEYGLIGLAIGGKKGAAVFGGLGHMKTWAENLSAALGMASAGVLDFKEVATANFKELEALVKSGEGILSGGAYYRGKIPELPAPSPTMPEANVNEEALPDMSYDLSLINYELGILQKGSGAAWAAYQAGIGNVDYDRFLSGIMASEIAVNNLEVAVGLGLEESLKSLSNQGEKTFGADLENAVTGWASTFSSTLTDMVWGADASFSNIAESFGKMITQMMIQWAIVEPLMTGMKSMNWGSLFDVGSSGSASYSSAVMSADYSTAVSGMSFFDKGGVFNSPFVFPLAGGAIGVGSEHGQSEAVMPLTRLPGGDLGVKSAGGGNMEVHIHNNSGAQATVKESKSAGGGMRLDVMIDNIMADKVTSGKTAKALRSSYGLSSVLSGR